MTHQVIVALRVVIGLALAGSVVVQVGALTLLWSDMNSLGTGIRVAVVTIIVLGVATLQVVGVCIWRLLTMVRRGTVFSPAAFRYVDVVIGAIATASALVVALAVTAAVANRTTPGDEVAPGLVLLMCGVALVIAGVALVVLVQRLLLAQAVARDSEAKHLETELGEVI